MRIDRLNFVASDFGFVNRTSPGYRIFLADSDLSLANLSNQLANGTAVARLRGKFMETGDTVAVATFRPEKKGADFGLKFRVENTDLTGMNEFLRAHGNFDVVTGRVSVYSELSVKDGEIKGYVKPLFRKLDVYDRRQDSDKAVSQKIYEAVVGALGTVLENRSSEAVATNAAIFGKVENPQTSTWEILGHLIQNAFFRTILPGFDANIPPAREGDPRGRTESR